MKNLICFALSTLFGLGLVVSAGNGDAQSPGGTSKSGPGRFRCGILRRQASLYQLDTLKIVVGFTRASDRDRFIQGLKQKVLEEMDEIDRVCEAEFQRASKGTNRDRTDYEVSLRLACSAFPAIRKPGGECQKFPPDPDVLAGWHDVCNRWNEQIHGPKGPMCNGLIPLPVRKK